MARRRFFSLQKSFLCVNRPPIRYACFRAGAKVIRYSMKIALTESCFSTNISINLTSKVVVDHAKSFGAANGYFFSCIEGQKLYVVCMYDGEIKFLLSICCGSSSSVQLL